MLPALEGEYGLLPASESPHRATLEEIFDLFVTAAPYSEDRKSLWMVFPSYVNKLRATFPTCRVLLDGGFTTHKPWAAPSDIDVSVGVDRLHFNALQDWQQAELFNTVAAGGQKIRVMGGAIDASRFQLGNPDKLAYWHEHWSSVHSADRTIVEGLRKGYVEVTE
ncbi:DUF6932 family protein [Arthrobacter ramosus]|uniref:DUF6932 family protein n=1 Tax=Arthrobacter ramosus TaxID=1672 RepID=A0ABV5Y4I9_ARTRM|nr:hypothetical protein [Arthrobacter ramosus]